MRRYWWHHLFTGLLAALSGGYALWTVFSQWWAALLFGAVWGLMIFNLDRYIVSSMKKRDNIGGEFLMALPRLVLAVIIAMVISKPLELKIFDKEIQAELIIMEQKTFKEQEDKVKARYTDRIAGLNAAIDKAKGEVVAQGARRDTLMLLAQQEADGTGGSRIRNLGPIYKAKKTDADIAAGAYDTLSAHNNALIAGYLQEISATDSTIKATITDLKRGHLDGFASRMDALGHLTDNSAPIRYANWFIILLFIAIETAPVFVKLISPRGPYDELLEQHEYAFIMHKKERKAMLTMETDERLTIAQAAREKRVKEFTE
ncbi:DUF4407 domain-containing protein [Chitinophaga sedimenti]|uniref:DUF4407 domain-containing protein n=1 Tax=Chitinophaga sedimenti TaxID=2033606 RepID=UPI002002BF6B|nr:DUF4407 domain-containing protein [Chitinophaga sedimenti]MCK7557049.1 DUF4407 domain-containing protein [Chitinophaga sedimenti]